VRPHVEPRLAGQTAVVIWREVVRKLMHLSSVVIPLFVWFAPGAVATGVLVGGGALALAVEVMRFRVRAFRYWFLLKTRRLLRRHERRTVTGATYLALSYAAAVVVFPTPVAVLAMLYSGVGDAMAAIVGRGIGRHTIRPGKSLEGAVAMFGVTMILGMLLTGIPLAAAVAGAAAATALEIAPLPPDDNVWVTLGGGAVVWAMIAAGV
jgi:dolichol kinase